MYQCRHISLKSLLLDIKSTLLSSSSLLLNSMGTIKFSKCREQFTFKTLSFKLNIKLYNRLNKKVTGFTEYKKEPAVPHTTKYFHHQNGEDVDNNKRYKMHI